MRDPRPQLAENSGEVLLSVQRCASCGYVSALERARCPVCFGELIDDTCGPLGTVWSSTFLRINLPERPAPSGLAYVDISDGPRVLAQFSPHIGGPLKGGTRVKLAGRSALGDLVIEVVP